MENGSATLVCNHASFNGPGTSVKSDVDLHLRKNVPTGECHLHWFFSKSDFRIYYKGTELGHRRGLVFLIRSDHELESCQLRFGRCQI